MKKKHHIIAPILCLLVAFSSCTKDKNTENQKLSELQRTGRSIGEAHNKALDFFLNNEIRKSYQSKPLNGKTMNIGEEIPQVIPTGTELITHVNAYYNTLPENAGSNIPLDLRTATQLDSCLTNFNTTDIKSLWHQALSPVSLNNIVTPREQAMLAELTAIFDGIYSGPMTGINNSLNYQLEALEAKYQNTVFEPNEGELFIGALNIAKSSNEYWTTTGSTIFNQETIGIGSIRKNASINARSNQSGPPPIIEIDLWACNTQIPIVQVDAIFYILGWVDAVADDISQNNLHPEGQWRRVRKGLYSGIAGSWGGRFRISQMNDIPFIPLSLMPIPVLNP